jgi:hypothetical protein
MVGWRFNRQRFRSNVSGDEIRPVQRIEGWPQTPIANVN